MMGKILQVRGKGKLGYISIVGIANWTCLGTLSGTSVKFSYQKRLDCVVLNANQYVDWIMWGVDFYVGYNRNQVHKSGKRV